MMLEYVCFKEYSPAGDEGQEGPGTPNQGESPSSVPTDYVGKTL